MKNKKFIFIFLLSSINYQTCQAILEKFANNCRKPEGKMGLNEFADYLGMKPSPIVEQIFNIYDKVNLPSYLNKNK